MIYLILGLLLAIAVAVWAMMERRKAVARAKEAEAAAAKRARQITKMAEAYRSEADKIEELARGTDAERFATSLRILRELSRPGRHSD